MFPHRNFHNYSWTFSDGKITNKNDHILIERRWHTCILDVRTFKGTDCDNDHYLVVEKLGKYWQ